MTVSPPEPNSPIAADMVPPPEPVYRPGADEIPDSFDDDLAWIVAKFVERTGCAACVISVHHRDGQAPHALLNQGALVAERDFEASIVADVEQAWERRRRDDAMDASGWDEMPAGAIACQRMMLPLAADANHRIVLTALHDPQSDASREQLTYMATRLQPVLAGYFKLWLVMRSQRRRLDGLASALNASDIAILLLDGSGGLLFTNHAARGLLDDVDGIRRAGNSIAATDVADAVKLRVAIDHVISVDRDSGAAADGIKSRIVPLRRRDDRRALIASVLPVEKSARGPADPTVVVYIFSPDINVGVLLLPICKIYGLSPSETRLVGLLAEGLSVHEAADRMRVKVPTLRTYLKQIFSKTGAQRQSDLIRLMMSSLVRTRSAGGHRII